MEKTNRFPLFNTAEYVKEEYPFTFGNLQSKAKMWIVFQLRYTGYK